MLSTNQKIIVIGAGQMGAGIAQVAAGAGCDVVLHDVSLEAAEAGKARIETALNRLVVKEKLTSKAKDDLLSKIRATNDITEVSDADFAIEAATENEELKLAIFSQLEKHAGPQTIFASNTSSISIAKMAAVTTRPEKVIGVHFMNPVPLMSLVELVRGKDTSDATYLSSRSLVEGWEKVVITSTDRPGFLVNRILIPFLNEACLCFSEKVGTAEDIDLGAKLGLNHPMGPLELADLIGLDTVLAISQVLYRELAEEKYRPAPLLEQYVAKGWLGRKSG